MGNVLNFTAMPPVFEPVKPFEDATSWSDIQSSIQKYMQGKVRLTDFWSIGDTKSVTLASGEVIELQIAGFNHDTFLDGVVAPVTLVMKNCLNTIEKYANTQTNIGGYPASLMPNIVHTKIYNMLPEDLRSMVSPVLKRYYTTYNNPNSIEQGGYDVWLLAEVEITGQSTVGLGTDEGTQYSLFTNQDNRRKKCKGASSRWWTRTIHRDSKTEYAVINTNGNAIFYNTVTPYGVVAGMCIR